MPPAEAIIANVSTVATKLKKKVIMHHEGVLGHHTVTHASSDPWHQWEGFVVILVLLHILILVFYAWVLYKDKGKQKRRNTGLCDNAPTKENLGRHNKSSGEAAGAAAAAAAGFIAQWRTPKDVLAAREKLRLGKV